MYLRAISITVLMLIAAATAQNPIVDTAYGPIRGVSHAGVNEFHQVPYGHAERWVNPVEPIAWTEPLDCTGAASGTGYSVGCSQNCGLPPLACPNVTQEDCLFLNIFTPEMEEERLPVMFFIHGGNFKMGFGDGALYNGSVLAKRNSIVVVTINYRLGALGFLSSGDGEITGNFGLLDQQAALNWTHNNIQFFSGDPNDITIFGQSAGGQSASIHSLIPATVDFGVTKILAESHPFGLPLRTATTWKGIYNSLKSKSKCITAKCLKDLPVDQLLSAAAAAETDILHELGSLLSLFEPWTPTAGGELLPDQPLFLYQQGKVNSGPIMNGVVSEEGRMFVFEALTAPVPPVEYAALMIALFGRDTGGKILKQYPLPEGTKDARDVASIAVTDGIFHCPNLNASRSMQSGPTRRGSTWFYEFSHVMSFFGNGSFGNFSQACEGHVCHQEELVFVFYPNTDDIQAKVGSTYSAAEELLGQRMNSYWGNYAKTGAPGAGDPSQPLRWSPMGSTETMMEFDLTDTIRTNAYEEKCRFWDLLGYPWLK